MQHAQHIDARMEECVTNCSDCHDICMESAAHALSQGIEHFHVRLLQDCAQICDTSRDFMLRGSPRHTQTCGLCADMCVECGDMCRTHDDPVMQSCADVCRRCAASCREMSGRHMKHAA